MGLEPANQQHGASTAAPRKPTAAHRHTAAWGPNLTAAMWQHCCSAAQPSEPSDTAASYTACATTNQYAQVEGATQISSSLPLPMGALRGRGRWWRAREWGTPAADDGHCQQAPHNLLGDIACKECATLYSLARIASQGTCEWTHLLMGFVQGVLLCEVKARVARPARAWTGWPLLRAIVDGSTFIFTVTIDVPIITRTVRTFTGFTLAVSIASCGTRPALARCSTRPALASSDPLRTNAHSAGVLHQGKVLEVHAPARPVDVLRRSHQAPIHSKHLLAPGWSNDLCHFGHDLAHGLPYRPFVRGGGVAIFHTGICETSLQAINNCSDSCRVCTASTRQT